MDRPIRKLLPGFSLTDSLKINRRALKAEEPLVTSRFSEAEILEANRHHDRHYGWTGLYPGIYTNAGRLPETVSGDLGWR